jgi:hypothetical protein
MGEDTGPEKADRREGQERRRATGRYRGTVWWRQWLDYIRWRLRGDHRTIPLASWDRRSGEDRRGHSFYQPRNAASDTTPIEDPSSGP